MKYFLIILILCVFCIQTECSEVNNQEFAIKTFKYSSPAKNSSLKDGKFKIHRYQPSELFITKNNYALQSSMKKDYIVRKYTIKNISEEPVSLEFDKGTDLTKAVEKTKLTRETKQSKTAFLIPLKDGCYDASNMIGANNGILFFAGIGSVIYNFGLKFPVYIGKSVFNTVAAPVYYFKNKKDDELIEEYIKCIKSISTGIPDKYVLHPYEVIQIRNLYQDWDYPSINAKLQNQEVFKFEIK